MFSFWLNAILAQGILAQGILAQGHFGSRHFGSRHFGGKEEEERRRSMFRNAWGACFRYHTTPGAARGGLGGMFGAGPRFVFLGERMCFVISGVTYDAVPRVRLFCICNN